MDAIKKTCTLVFDYLENGLPHCHADCGPCYTIQFAFVASGPWYKWQDGVVGQDIVLPVTSERRYYRVISRDCEVDAQGEPLQTL